MCTTIRRLILTIAISATVLSCNMSDDNDSCGIYLEFIFDYNMQFADLFGEQVETVDVFIFDENGKFLLHKNADRTTLHRGKRMYLNKGLRPGTYQLLTVGGLTEHFRFTDIEDNDLVRNETTIQQVKLALVRHSCEVSHEFAHLWFSQTTKIRHRNDRSVWPVYLIRNTNNFKVEFYEITEETDRTYSDNVPYIFEIITPEGGAYGYDNNPLLNETVSYRPYYLQHVQGPADHYMLKLNTMRLFADHPDGYRIVVRDKESSGELWGNDLMVLLAKADPRRPDGTSIPLQEYLDREGEWRVVIPYRKETTGDGFVAIRIIVNGWIIWENDIEI